MNFTNSNISIDFSLPHSTPPSTQNIHATSYINIQPRIKTRGEWEENKNRKSECTHIFESQSNKSGRKEEATSVKET